MGLLMLNCDNYHSWRYAFSSPVRAWKGKTNWWNPVNAAGYMLDQVVMGGPGYREVYSLSRQHGGTSFLRIDSQSDQELFRLREFTTDSDKPIDYDDADAASRPFLKA